MKFLFQVERMLNELLGGTSSVTTKHLLGGLGLMVIQSKEEAEGDDAKMEVKMEMEPDPEQSGSEFKRSRNLQTRDFKFHLSRCPQLEWIHEAIPMVNPLYPKARKK